MKTTITVRSPIRVKTTTRETDHDYKLETTYREVLQKVKEVCTENDAFARRLRDQTMKEANEKFVHSRNYCGDKIADVNKTRIK